MEVLISTFVPVTPEQAFDLSLDIGVHLDSMAHSKEVAIAGVKEGLIALGESVTWKARHFGVTWRMTSKITELERPEFFVDEQVKGPFAKFHHLHRFEATEGGTTMTDQIRYRAPFSILGHSVDRVVLNRYLKNLIMIRNEFIVSMAGKNCQTMSSQFGFDFEPAVQRWNALFGVHPHNTHAIVVNENLTVQFGRWKLKTPISNIVSAEITGPYRRWKIAGPARYSWKDHSVTFATNATLGLCLSFREPVRAIDPLGLIRHPSLTLTVKDPVLLAKALGFTEPLRHSTTSRGTFLGAIRALLNWMARKDSVKIINRRDGEPDLFGADEVQEDERVVTDQQTAGDGVGPWFHRRYRVELQNATLSPEELLKRIAANPNVIADERFAPFVKERGDENAMNVGDRYVVETPGPWNGPVEVVDVGVDHFRFVTLEGHMESGSIEMHAQRDGDVLVFEIESWARSGDRAFDAFYDKVGIGKALQSEMWVRSCELAAEIAGGEQRGSITIVDEKCEKPDRLLAN